MTCVCTTPALGQTGPFVEVSGDLSPVRIGGTNVTWQVAHVAGGVQRDDQFGWMATADRHQRGQLVDFSFGASGFRRMGAWTIFGSGAFASRQVLRLARCRRTPAAAPRRCMDRQVSSLRGTWHPGPN